MDSLLKKILSFSNWSQPWTFYDFIISDNEIPVKYIELFKEIWKKGSDFKLWNFSDLTLGCKMAHNFIKEEYKLTDEITSKIVRAISYEWK